MEREGRIGIKLLDHDEIIALGAELAHHIVEVEERIEELKQLLGSGCDQKIVDELDELESYYSKLTYF